MYTRVWRKGNVLIFTYLDGEIGRFGATRGNSILAGICRRQSWEEFSFLYKEHCPWNELSSRQGRSYRKTPRLPRCPLRCRRPLKLPGTVNRFSRQAVPISAAGLQGEQPLVDSNNVGKGSRQIRSVTSGKGLALRAGSVGLRMRSGPGICEGWVRLLLVGGRARTDAETFSWSVRSCETSRAGGSRLRRVVLFGRQLAAGSELVRTWGIRLSN